MLLLLSLLLLALLLLLLVLLLMRLILLPLIVSDAADLAAGADASFKGMKIQGRFYPGSLLKTRFCCKIERLFTLVAPPNFVGGPA